MIDRNTRKLAGSVVALLVLLGPATSEAHAYIDPGTGSSLFASLGVMLGVVTAVFALGLSQLRRICGWFVTRFTPRRKEKPLIPDLAARR